MHALRIGRIFGIDIRVDSSWGLIFVLLGWNLYAVFSRWHVEWPPLVSLAVATAATLLFFVCVLVHELAHCLVAMSYGVSVRNITLHLFGGVSNMQREPPSPTAELLIAVVGPLTSIALGVGFSAIAGVLTAVSMTDASGTFTRLPHMGPITTLFVWLGSINVMIGLFNLIPGFPLDGGRVLRAVLWRATGDLHRATRWAASVGQAVGWTFIACGVAMVFGVSIPFFGTGFVGGLWLAFIGWFLHSAAAQAAKRVALDEVLAGLTVEQLMQRHGPAVAPEVSVAELVAHHLLHAEERSLPVVHDGVLRGLVSMAEVRPVPPNLWAVTKVGTITRDLDTLETATLEEPFVGAYERLARRDIGQLPVLDDGQFVGMLRRRDITRWIELAWRPGAPSRPSGGRGDTSSPELRMPRHPAPQGA